MKHEAQIVVNTLNYSLELFKWIDDDESIKEEKKFMTIANKMFDYLTGDFLNHQNNKMIGIGNTYSKYEEGKHNDDEISYVLYEGTCKDKKNLTYFIPKRILKKGKFNISEINKYIK